jgi:hypothetical protein
MSKSDERTARSEGEAKTRTSEPDDPPGAMSNQNREEAQSELRDDQTHPEPRSSERSSGVREGSKRSS